MPLQKVSTLWLLLLISQALVSVYTEVDDEGISVAPAPIRTKCHSGQTYPNHPWSKLKKKVSLRLALLKRLASV